MPDKPSYLGLLNAISCAETRAHAYLSAWADVTPDPDVRAVLHKVALREYEHGAAFAKRINELGFDLKETDDPGFEKNMEIVRSDRSDLEKLEAIGLLQFCSDDEPDIFDGFFRDHSIDIQTGELLGRYIAEERDTLRLVQGCKAQLEARGTAAPSQTDDRFVALEEKIDAVCRGVEELRQIVCAQAMPAESV
jgi:rubrerythrin